MNGMKGGGKGSGEEKRREKKEMGGEGGKGIEGGKWR